MRRIFLIIGVLLLTAVLAEANRPREILLVVDQQPFAWGRSLVSEQLLGRLTRDPGIRVRQITIDSARSRMLASNDLDRLVALGQMEKADVLAIVRLEPARLEARKGFNIPLVLHKWETVGILDGELRVVDITQGRLLAAEPINNELIGPKAVQMTMDDNRHDPDLRVRATEKELFAAKLQEQLAVNLAERLRPLLRMRDRENFAQKASSRRTP